MNQFEENIINSYGSEGKKWLANIQTLQVEFAEKHSLVNLRPLDNLSYNYVAMGLQQQKPIILKLGMNYKALKREAKCLDLLSKTSAPELIAWGEGMLLMKRAIPGDSLVTYFPDADNEAMDIVSVLLKKIHSSKLPECHDFYTLDYLFTPFDRQQDIPEQLLASAKNITDKLIATSEKKVLLHGDLHHENIINDESSWLVIDPKGFVGDPIYDVVAFIRNPIPQLLASSNAINIIRHRINYFSLKMGYPAVRILQWCFVQSVLAWSWILEDGGAEENFQRLTRLFFSLLTSQV